MKRFLALLVLVSWVPSVLADGPDEDYIGIYSIIQKGDALNNSGDKAKAMEQYLAAQSALKKFQSVYPDWNSKIIGYRAQYLSTKITEISTKTPPATIVMPPATANLTPTQAPPTTPAIPATNVEVADPLKSLQDQVGRLNAEKVLLEAKLKEALAAQPASLDPGELVKAQQQITDLRKANDLLKVSLEDARNPPITLPASGKNKGDEGSRKLAEAQTQVSNLKADRDTLKLQNAALENRIKQLASANSTPAVVAPVAVPVDNSAATAELNTLRARLAVLEAQKVPFTAEELALLKVSPAQPLATAAATPVTTAPVRKAPKKLPAGAETLRSEAQRFFVAKQFDKAKEKYLALLNMDDQNVVILGNLASIEIELKQVGEAEAHLKQALAIEPSDPYNLRVLGRLKFQQKQYDEALDLLSRAAQVDAKDPVVQNYLGLVLDAKGNRSQAETAFRKALQIDPKYADAHNNLAVSYVTQQPPLLELARWHYDKSRSFGAPANAELEKMLNGAKSPDAAK